MKPIKKQYIVDGNNKNVGVKIDIEAYNKLEEVVENYGLAQLMKENEGDETLSLHEAQKLYKILKD